MCRQFRAREEDLRMRRVKVAIALSLVLVVAACNGPPPTTVVFDNDYPPSATGPLVIYEAYWQAVSFPNPEAGDVGGIPPGASSDPETTLPASANTAYVLLAPGWDPSRAAPPTSFVVLWSRSGFGVEQGDTLHIPVDDANFVGNCATGDPLSQDKADFVTQFVFPSVFAGRRYDAKTCETSVVDSQSP
jgi:hypothetical protein